MNVVAPVLLVGAPPTSEKKTRYIGKIVVKEKLAFDKREKPYEESCKRMFML